MSDEGDRAVTNFSSGQGAAVYAGMYKEDGLKGGHVILLNSKDSKHYEATKAQAFAALRAYPGGLQVGGGITAENAAEYLEAGASHVIVTSYVFRDGRFDQGNLDKLLSAVGRDHVVLDVSCRRRGGDYFIVTDRWQKFTELKLTCKVLDGLSRQCDEFLVHGVDVEGKSSGVEEVLVKMLWAWDGAPVTYAGGIGSMGELSRFQELCGGRLDFTVGSALDLFGGPIPYQWLCGFR